MRLHPQPTRDQQMELDYVLKRSPLIVKTMAATMACFPPMPTAMMRRSGMDREGSARHRAREEGQKHQWVYGAGKWRCGRCARMTTAENLTVEHRNQRCDGPKRSLDVRDMTARGHQIMAADCTPPIAYCVRCGAFSVRRAVLLRKACAGTPAPNGRAALKRIARGLHPWDHGVSLRSSGGFGTFYAWNTARDSWAPRGGIDGSATTSTHDEVVLEASAARDHASAAAGTDGLMVISPPTVATASPTLSAERACHDEAEDVLPPTATIPRNDESDGTMPTFGSRQDLLRRLRAKPGRCGAATAPGNGEAATSSVDTSLVNDSRHPDAVAHSGRPLAHRGVLSQHGNTSSQRLSAPATRNELLRRLAGT